MPRKLFTKKREEVLAAADEASSWLMQLEQFKPIWNKTTKQNVSAKEKSKIESIYGFCPTKDDRNTVPLALINCIEALSEVPYNRESVIEENYYDYCGCTKDGYLVLPNNEITKIPIGSPPQQIKFIINWNYPIWDILKRIEEIIKQIQFLHRIKLRRPRKKVFIIRIDEKLLLRKNRLPKNVTVNINWDLCPGAIVKKMKPIIECLKNKYGVTETRPQYTRLTNRYKTHVLTKLGYPRKQIEEIIFMDYSNMITGKSYDSYQKRAYRASKKGASSFL